MRRASAVLSLLVLLVFGGSTAASAAEASAADWCGIAGNVVPPIEDDCRETLGFVGDTIERQGDNVFFVFCTVFPTHPACA